MNVRMIAACALLAASLPWGSAALAAEEVNGHDLLKQCERLGSGLEQNYYAGTCAGYIVGVIDSHNGVVSADLMPEPHFCVPSKVDRAQLVDQVVSYVEEHPEQHDFGAATLVWIALVQRYPCLANSTAPQQMLSVTQPRNQ